MQGCISMEEIFANHPSENFTQPIILEGAGFEFPSSSAHEPRPHGGVCWGLCTPLWAPCQAETSLLTAVPRVSFFYVPHTNETQWEASGSVLTTLVPTHLHPKLISSPCSYRGLSMEETLWVGELWQECRPWLVITGRHKFMYWSSDALQNNRLFFFFMTQVSFHKLKCLCK